VYHWFICFCLAAVFNIWHLWVHFREFLVLGLPHVLKRSGRCNFSVARVWKTLNQSDSATAMLYILCVSYSHLLLNFICTMKFCVVLVSSWPHQLYANEGLDYLVMLPDSLMMSKQTRQAVKLKKVSDHHPTGSVPRSNSHYLDSSDPLGHGNTGD